MNAAQVATQGAGVIVRLSEKVLLVRVNYGPAKGQWILPGGMVEKGERPEVTAVREVKEETGLDVKVTSLAAIRHRLLDDGRANIYWVFRAEIKDSKASMSLRWPSDEIQEARFWLEQEALEADSVRSHTRLYLSINDVPSVFIPNVVGPMDIIYSPPLWV